MKVVVIEMYPVNIGVSWREGKSIMILMLSSSDLKTISEGGRSRYIPEIFLMLGLMRGSNYCKMVLLKIAQPLSLGLL